MRTSQNETCRFEKTATGTTQLTLHPHSIAGASKTPEDTEKAVSRMLPSAPAPTPHSLVFAVHERLATAAGADAVAAAADTRFVGLVKIVPTTAAGLPLPPPFVPAAAPTALVVELAYMFLPFAWGRGLATEAVGAVIGAAREAGTGFWAPWERVWVRVIVNGRNGPSARVMEKVGLRKMGVYKWEGERIWIGGEWMVKDDLSIFGDDLLSR
jgi:RimJ/RimL family protein N-acetyltransferase